MAVERAGISLSFSKQIGHSAGGEGCGCPLSLGLTVSDDIRKESVS